MLSRILLPIIGIVVVLAAIVILTSLYIAKPTNGEPIAQYNNPKSALLVIDVQNDTTSNSNYYGDTTNFVAKVNQAISSAQKQGMEIIYIKNEYGNNPFVSLIAMGKHKKDSAGADLDHRLQVVNNHIFSKSIGDSFASPAFEKYLISKDIKNLYLVGADAAACIYSTAQGGLNRNYIVNVIKDSIITVNDKTMAEMIQKYEKDGIGIVDLISFNK
jgi:nicotinamidase-related amidase